MAQDDQPERLYGPTRTAAAMRMDDSASRRRPPPPLSAMEWAELSCPEVDHTISTIPDAGPRTYNASWDSWGADNDSATSSRMPGTAVSPAGHKPRRPDMRMPSAATAAAWLTRYLPTWLLVVAALRFLSIGIALFRPQRLQLSLFAGAPEQLTPLAARLFAAWTASTGSLLVVCALDGARPRTAVFAASALSFVLVLAVFAPEVAVHGTMTPASVATPAVVASTSLAWMLVVWGAAREHDGAKQE